MIIENHFKSLTVKLDGLNHLTRSRLAILPIQSHGLYRYLIDESTKPYTSYPLNDKRIDEKSLLMLWRLLSMQLHISRGYMLLSTAQELW